MALIANMVGKNEADRYLKEVLTHLSPIVDEIVFTDDASTDNTADIAEKYATVYRNDESWFETNEGALRTKAWRNLSQHAKPGDWILAIDCDEKLWCDSRGQAMSRLMSQTQYDVISIVFYHMWNRTQYRVDKAWRPSGSFRLFRYYLGGKFKDKALACGSEPTYVETLVRRGKIMKQSGLVMQHLGYMDDEAKKAKYDRYMQLDHGNYHSLAHIESILDPDPVLELWKPQ